MPVSLGGYVVLLCTVAGSEGLHSWTVPVPLLVVAWFNQTPKRGCEDFSMKPVKDHLLLYSSSTSAKGLFLIPALHAPSAEMRQFSTRVKAFSVVAP